MQGIRAEQEAGSAAESQQIQTDIQSSTQTNAPLLRPAQHNPSSIYPEATRGINGNSAGYPPPAPANEVEDTPETYKFEEGFEIGKTVFIYQLVAGLVIGLLSSHITQTFLHIPFVLAIIYIAEFLITLVYLTYRVLRSEAIKEPLWITLIGTAAQTLFLAMGYALMTLLLKMKGSLGIYEIVFVIGFLVASYFLTKLAWGVAFSLVGRVKNNVIIKVIGIGLITLFIGSIVYHFVTQPTTKESGTLSNATTSTQSSASLTKYIVAGKPSYSVNFYAGSKVSSEADGGGNITYSTGHAVQGVSLSLSNAITVNATTSCRSSANNSEFSFQIQGSTGIVCVTNNKNLTSYIGYIQINGRSYVIHMFAFSYQQNLATVKTIFNSITIE